MHSPFLVSPPTYQLLGWCYGPALILRLKIIKPVSDLISIDKTKKKVPLPLETDLNGEHIPEIYVMFDPICKYSTPLGLARSFLYANRTLYYNNVLVVLWIYR